MANSLQMIMEGDGGADGCGGSSSSGNRRFKKRRRRVVDLTGSASRSQSDHRYSGSDFYESQILGGVNAGDHVEPPVADYFDGFGRYVGNELRQMDKQSVILAKRLMNEVLFLGQMGLLTVNTRVETPPPPSTTSGRRKTSTSVKMETHYQHQNDGGRYESSTLTPPVEFMETS